MRRHSRSSSQATLDLPTGHFGAFEIVAAVGKVMIGSAAFPALANPAVAMKGMTA
jgi:hypothetical protein